MKSKRIYMLEKRVECLLNCRHFAKCIARNGNECKHLGGKRIPRFREPVDIQTMVPEAEVPWMRKVM